VKPRRRGDQETPRRLLVACSAPAPRRLHFLLLVYVYIWITRKHSVYLFCFSLRLNESSIYTIAEFDLVLKEDLDAHGRLKGGVVIGAPCDLDKHGKTGTGAEST